MDFGSRCAGRSEGDSDAGGHGDGQLPIPGQDGAGGVAPDWWRFRPMSDEQ